MAMNRARVVKSPWGSIRRAMTSQGVHPPKNPVRLVLFDVFDTLCTPRLPIHQQYYDEAVSANIPASSISPSSVRAAFKSAFKEMDAKWPLYGKHSKPPLTPGEWWTELIRRCMLNAGADDKSVDKAMPTLGPALLARFESNVGYRNFPETIECLQRLRQLGIKTSLVTNADPRILHTLDALEITPHLTHPPTLSWEVEKAKPDRGIFHAACMKCNEEPGDGVIMIGDELKADYHGARGAGLEARLIRRRGEWSDGAARHASEGLKDVHNITNLLDIIQEVQSRNQS